jgi:hypothetical protein
MTLFLLITIVVTAILALRARGRQGQAEDDWLPAELHGATLVWTEQEFRCSRPVPMVARIDRVYLGPDGKLTLVEFKHRATCRAYHSDVVELSVQRHVMRQSGHVVNRRAYVAVVPTRGGRLRALAVQLEDGPAVESRALRLLALRDGEVHPQRSVQPAVCSGCGHQSVCPHAQEIFR